MFLFKKKMVRYAKKIDKNIFEHCCKRLSKANFFNPIAITYLARFCVIAKFLLS